MANTFDEQARDRFTKSLKFMEKAEALLEDDLVYRSALADAVSSIKNMLQGYLLLRVAATPASAVTQRWQEVAASNRMPDLITACGEAGLDLSGLAVDIRRLNSDRNNRAHDDPQRHIDSEQAAHAIETARTLQRRIKAAVQGRQEVRSLPQMAAQAAHVVRAAASGQLRASVATAPRRSGTLDGATPTVATSSAVVSSSSPDEALPAARSAPAAVAERPPESEPASVAAESSSAVEALDDSDDSSGDLPAISSRRRKRGRGVRVLLRVLAAAALLLVGIGTGVGITVPVESGNAPSWLAFATHLLPSPSSATQAARLTPTPTVDTGPRSVGTLTIGAPACAAGNAAFTLFNDGNTPARWSIGSPDAPAAVFAASPGVTGIPTLSGELAPGAIVTVYAANPGAATGYHAVILTVGGTGQLLVPAC